MYTMSDSTKEKMHALVLAVEDWVYLESVDPPASWEDRHTAAEKVKQTFYALKPGSGATRAGDYERFRIYQPTREHA